MWTASRYNYGDYAAYRDLGVNDESTLRYAFTALWAHYEGDIRQKSVCARVSGFHRLMILTRGALVANWMVSPDDSPEIILLHPAVVAAVAMTRLGRVVRWYDQNFFEPLNDDGSRDPASCLGQHREYWTNSGLKSLHIDACS
jgi:hypothetical protein